MFSSDMIFHTIIISHNKCFIKLYLLIEILGSYTVIQLLFMSTIKNIIELECHAYLMLVR